MSIRIENIQADNFKIFENFDKIKEIDETSMVLLTGPNGYGKTSVFDAIELALTGRIKRIETYNKNINGIFAYENMILVRDENKEAYVSLTIKVEDKIIEIRRIFKPESKKVNSSTNKNPNKIFNHFKLRIKINNQVYEGKEAEKKLEELKLNDFKDIYGRCYFISQDENLNFFKSKDDAKINSLNFLFNTEKEDIKVDELEKIYNKYNKNKGILVKINDEKTRLESKIKELEEKISEGISGKDNSKDILLYRRIFEDKLYYWDKEDHKFTSEEYIKAIKDIDDLKYFAKNQESCIGYLFNKKYNELLVPFNGDEKINIDRNQLEYTIRFNSTLLKYNDIVKRHDVEEKYKKLQKDLNTQNYNGLNWSFIKEEKIFTKDQEDTIKTAIQNIKQIESNTKAISKVIDEIMDSRNQLINFFNKAISNEILKNDVCPLCGMNYSNKNELITKIKQQEDNLNELCDKDVIEKNKIINNLKESYFDKLLVDINKKLEKTIEEKDFLRLKEIKKNESKIINIVNKLNELDIQIPKLDIDGDLKDIYNDYLDRIKKKLFSISDEVLSGLIERNFEECLLNYYDNDEEKLKKITLDMLDKKEKYIKACYFNYNKKLLDNTKLSYDKYVHRYDKLKKILERISNYKDCINDGISNYKRKVIEDIEPILYIYVAKILQRKFNGNSIMIWKNYDLSQIRFVNSQEDDQDILHSMSSGQLASVAIAFLLCMNKIYSRNMIDILLIDDPIQTIDDVNMVGLVDLLRYEFNDKQIFISTHERKFELYLRYKYQKTNHKCSVFNMKDLVLAENEN
ncbi:hypothetical protein FDC50_15270 [Clostridium botulinum]|nr:hypothetical protein KU41_01100 [Clostridium botulinum]MBY6803371.1 AAA family ATPase [Clostridium botulinum]MBY6813916.1 AAA family ATPase [Clostridium botulinum]MBY6820143.1 AAA family ATPase [Clostridium botulinum]NFJ52556.1 hypothetical protein [Clostridium botulinum]